MPGLGDMLYEMFAGGQPGAPPQPDPAAGAQYPQPVPDPAQDLAGTQYAGGGVSPALKQHFERSGRGLLQGMEKAFSDMGPITPGPGAAQTLRDARGATLEGQAGLNDIGNEKTDEWIFPAAIPPDPRMLAYQNQRSGQLAQEAWNRQPQQPQMAQPAPQGTTASFADALYRLLSPALQTGSAGGRRY